MTLTDETDLANDEEQESGSARDRALRWRDQVIRYLRSDGHLVGRPLLPEGGAWTDKAEIDGVPGWSILCRRQKLMNLPGSVAKAADHAARHGNPRAATVLHRRDHPLSDAYVLMELSTFSALLKELSPTSGAAR